MLQDCEKLDVDANGHCDLESAIAYAKAQSQYDPCLTHKMPDRPRKGG